MRFTSRIGVHHGSGAQRCAVAGHASLVTPIPSRPGAPFGTDSDSRVAPQGGAKAP
jgi:hypothetical protein